MKTLISPARPLDASTAMVPELRSIWAREPAIALEYERLRCERTTSIDMTVALTAASFRLYLPDKGRQPGLSMTLSLWARYLTR